MASSPASTWISLLEHDLLNDDVSTALWMQQQQQHQQQHYGRQQQQNHHHQEFSFRTESDSLNQDNSSSWKSWDDEASKGDSFNQDKASLRKRTRDESQTCCSKASREKMRRDRLNDRFMELSAILEPEKPPKTDKASILRDAARVLTQMRTEMKQLKDINNELQETIKELKAEKNELRNEKLSLKCDNANLEKQVKMMTTGASGYGPHPSRLAGGPYASSGIQHGAHQPEIHQRGKKLGFFPELPYPMMMSDYMPPTTVDVSSDHILRPPVA